jgi:hypothetical protein
MFCDSLLHVCLSTTVADARWHTLHDQSEFTPFKEDDRESIKSFSLPANETDHDNKNNLT